MKHILLYVILTVAVLPATAQNIEGIFDDFAKESEKEFSYFREEANREFIDILKESWVEFDIMAGKEYPIKPKPMKAPVAVNIKANDSITILSVPLTDTVFRKANTLKSNIQINRVNNQTHFYFYNVPIWLPESSKLLNYKMADDKESDVAKFWEYLSSESCRIVNRDILKCTQNYISQMNLNDWGTYLLVNMISTNVWTSTRLGEREVYVAYLLNQLGKDARLGLADGELVTIIAVEEQLYARTYCEYNGRKYYFPPELGDINKFLSYRKNFPMQQACISLKIDSPLSFIGDENTIVRVNKESSVFSIKLSLPINLNLCNFYNDYPQVDIEIYAKALVDTEFSRVLLSALKPHLKDKTEIEQVGLLMKFLHYDFNYKTDIDQFGYEKPFFIEEDFLFSYNDCEDRSILFSYLVRELVGLNVILIDYPDHIATAVCFNEDVDGMGFDYNGKRYTICDPTYIGANIGMIMDGYENQQFKIISI